MFNFLDKNQASGMRYVRKDPRNAYVKIPCADISAYFTGTNSVFDLWPLYYP